LATEAGAESMGRRVAAPGIRGAGPVLTAALIVAPVAAAGWLLIFGRTGNAVAVLLCTLPVGLSVLSLSAARPLMLSLVVITPFWAIAPAARPHDLNWYAYLALAGGLLVVRDGVELRRAARDPVVLLIVYLLCSFAVLFIVGVPVAIGDCVMLANGLWLYWLLRRSSEHERSLFISLVLAFAVAQASIGICQSVFGFPTFRTVIPELAIEERNPLAFFFAGLSNDGASASGTFSHFNALGALLALALPLLMYRIPRRLFRVCRPAALALIALGLWFTYSRGAWIGAALGVGAALWWLVRRGLDNRQPRRHRRRKRPWLWITVGITVGIALIATAGSLYEPGRAYYLETNNVSSRVTTYRFVWDQTVSSPARVAFGAGFSRFHGDLLPQHRDEHPGILGSVHSVPLQILAEGGVLALTLLVLAVASPVAAPFRRGATREQAAVGGALLAILVAGLVDTALFGYTGVLAFGLLAVQRGALAAQQPCLSPPSATLHQQAR